MGRASLIRFAANTTGPDKWLPATEGLWEWWPIEERDGFLCFAGPRLLIVRGVRDGDDGMCVPCKRTPDGGLVSDDTHRSVRQLEPAAWAFLRPLLPDDPEIPGA